MMITAALLAGIGYILFSWVHDYTSFLIVYLGVISVSFTAGFVHAPTIVAKNWFIRLRARAMTVVSAAVPIDRCDHYPSPGGVDQDDGLAPRRTNFRLAVFNHRCTADIDGPKVA
jgi:hypothetical protein